jgi:uncharacterized membrane protein YwaF
MHSIFGTKHLCLIAVSVALIVALFLLSKKVKLSAVFKIAFYVGVVSEFIKVFYYIVTNEETHGGILPKTDLPFHLCSIQILFIVFINFSKNEKIKRVLMSFMMPSCLFGGIAAILIATSSSLNGLFIITVQYFAYHVAITVLALRMLFGKELSLSISDYFNCLKFLAVLMFVAFYVNSILYDGVSNINFMYVASPPQSGLPFLTEKYGWLVYIAHYASLILICVSLFYIKPIVSAIKEKLSKKARLEEAKEREECTIS